VRAESPVELPQLVLGVARDRQTAQENDPAAVLELVADGGELGAEPRQRKVVTGDLAPGEAARPDGGERSIELGERAGGEGADPIRRARQVACEPGGGPRDRPRGRGSHLKSSL
jgi:hypothetical protein